MFLYVRTHHKFKHLQGDFFEMYSDQKNAETCIFMIFPKPNTDTLRRCYEIESSLSYEKFKNTF